MHIKRIDCDKKVEIGEVRVKFENDEKLSLTIYKEEDTEPKTVIEVTELSIENSTLFDEFIRWVKRCCMEYNINEQINVEENVFNFIMTSITD